MYLCWFMANERARLVPPMLHAAEAAGHGGNIAQLFPFPLELAGSTEKEK